MRSCLSPVKNAPIGQGHFIKPEWQRNARTWQSSEELWQTGGSRRAAAGAAV